jgi:DNA mismatch repair protein MutS2
VVAIDLLIPTGKSGVIISGPNTGGKTVALKTLGLLCLMAQSGFLLPVAEDSSLPIFQGIFADIGDPQSLEQSLSTFAAHMQNLADILRNLSVPALVVFDEPGGGTDPGEGGALACGILTYLKTCGVMVAAATHLTPVKLFALAEGSYQVAAVEFDLETLTPHYRLHYDTIGQSLGLSMARRLGVPEAACAAAEALLSPEARHLSQAMATLEEMRTALEHDRTLAAAEREQATALRLQQQALVAELEEKKRLIQAALTEARLLVRRLRQEGRTFIVTLQQRFGVTPTEQHQARVELAHVIHQQEEAIKTKEQALPPLHSAEPSLLQVGDEVEVRDRQLRGELIAVQGDRVRIRYGSLTVEVPAAQVHKVG